MPKFCLPLLFVSFILLQATKKVASDVAKGKVTRTQTGEDGSAGVDGDTSTSVVGNDWWEVDLCSGSDCSMPFLYDIIVITNSLGTYFVSMMDSFGREVIRLHHKGSAGSTSTSLRQARYMFVPPIRAKTARVTGDYQQTQLAEFQANGWTSVNQFVEDNKKDNVQNVAVGQLVSQSSNYARYYADKAVDGNTDGSARGQSYSVTLAAKANWWEISFGVPVLAKFVVVYNNDHPSFKKYLKNFTVQFFKEKGELVKEVSVQSPTAESSYLVSLQGWLKVSAIRINMASATPGYLSLAEVEVYGHVDWIEF